VVGVLQPKERCNLQYLGCGSLNSGLEYAAFRTDNYGGANDLLAIVSDCFVWDMKNGSPTTALAYGKASNGKLTVSQCSAGKVPGSEFYEPNGTTLTNELFTDAIDHLPLRQGGKGAEQLYAIGAFLSEHDAVGYDQPQLDKPLWPFPSSQELITKPASDGPVASTQSLNPYAGSALDGSPLRLTKRIWEATGKQMPSYASLYP